MVGVLTLFLSNLYIKFLFKQKPFFKSHTHYVSGVVSKIQVHF